MKIEVNFSKRNTVLGFVVGLIIAGLIIGYAYAGTGGVGHDINNVGCGSGYSTSCDANSDGMIDNAASVPWSGVTGKPAGFADNTDDGDCILYTNVHSQVCPAGKYVMKYSFRGSTDCLSFVNYQCSIPYITQPGNCPTISDIFNNISFGYQVGTTSKSCRATDAYPTYKGDVLCC